MIENKHPTRLEFDNNSNRLVIWTGSHPHTLLRVCPEAEFIVDNARWIKGALTFPKTLHTALLLANIYNPQIAQDVKNWIQGEIMPVQFFIQSKDLCTPVWSELREYQKRGASFLKGQKAALLADSVGLGKTIQAIAAAQIGPNRRLVICPNSLKGWWHDQIVKYCPGRIVHVCGQGKNAIPEHIEHFCWDWNIVHWEVIRNLDSLRKLKRFVWDVIIADEAHRIKNRRTQTAMNLKQLRSRQRWALTATPYSNLPSDMFSILQWLRPSVYTSYWKFYALYVNFVQGQYRRIDLGPKHVDTLAWELNNVMLRREPQDVFEEVPPVTYTTIKVDMTGKQRESYDVARREALLRFEGVDDIPIPNAIARIMRLRQIACDPSLIGAPGESAKLDALNDLVGMSEEPVVIFTTFRSVAEQVVKRFEGCSLYIGGSLEDEIRSFQSGKTQILVGTTGAMSEGFNLQRARRIIFVDLPWSSVKYIQAVGRVRPGLDGRIVEVINIEARNSVDSVVRDVLDGKLSGSSEVYSAIRESLRV